MFDPFFSTKYLGRGLGLAVVSGIVRACQGTILVNAKPGLGTSIRVVLPLADCHPPAEVKEDKRASTRRGNGEPFQIVDHHPGLTRQG